MFPRRQLPAALAAALLPAAATAGEVGMYTGNSSLGPFVRTPEHRFENLPGFPYAPHYLDFRGLRVHYLDEGPADGPVALLLHGEPSWCYLYRKMIPAIVAAGCRAVAPDLLGFGRSDKLVRRGDYSHQLQVDYLAWFIGELRLQDITLFCQDWGGLVGLRVVADRPELFARVIAANTALPGNPPGTTLLRSASLRTFVGFPSWLLYSQLVPVFSAGKIVQFGTVSRLPREVVAAYDAPFPDRSCLAAARAFPALVFSEVRQNTAAWQRLARFDKPFLTAFSDRDPILGGGDKIFQRAVAGAHGQPHTTIRGGGHFLQEDKGEELGELVVNFIRS